MHQWLALCSLLAGHDGYEAAMWLLAQHRTVLPILPTPSPILTELFTKIVHQAEGGACREIVTAACALSSCTTTAELLKAL